MRSAELDEFVEKVSERTDIYSVVSQYVTLSQRSGRYWGNCPFHNEKTASFSVSPDKGLFYCFGCGAGGNVFKFLSLIEN
ncbi:MAG: DNA primase, partial [Selenomonadaceae bacterium]|nr:DNA primase [Selenomonadaceae bacterium]